MKLSRKLLIISLFPLILSACNSENSNDSSSNNPNDYKGFNTTAPMLSSVTDFNPYDRNSKGEIVPLGEFVYPFNTSITMTVFYPKKDKKPTDIVDQFEYDIQKYHTLFDRHYYYKKKGSNTIINNVRVINESYGSNKPIKVEKELFDILAKSKKMMSLSNGKFNITIGNLSSVWDEYIDGACDIWGRQDEYVDKSIKQEKIVFYDPPKKEIKKALETVLTVDELDKSLVLNEETSEVTFKAVPRLEEKNLVPSLTLGGIGKGEATELFVDTPLAKKYCVRVNSGTSSIKFSNQRIDGGKWGISFSNPLYYEKHLAVGLIKEIPLNDTEYKINKDGSFGLSTSGFYQQYFFDDTTALRRHHIINPETGYSNYYTDTENYEGTFDAITLLMDDAGLSDMYTTALMNTTSLEEANALLDKLNEGFNTNGEALYFKRCKEDKNIKEELYVPESLESSIEVKKDLKYPLSTKLITY